MQAGLVGGAAADDHRKVELADEALEVEGLDRLGDVLGRDDRALDDQDVELGGQAGRRQRLRALGRHRRRRRDARLLHLADARRDQLGDDRLAVHLLHAGRGLLVVELADLLEEVGRILVAGPQALEIQHAEPAEPAQLDGRGRAHHPVHGRAQQRQLEAVGVDLPGDVDVLGVPGAPAGHDGDVVQPVGLPPGLVNADLDLSHMFALRHSMGPVRLTVHTGMAIANAGPDTPTIHHFTPSPSGIGPFRMVKSAHFARTGESPDASLPWEAPAVTTGPTPCAPDAVRTGMRSLLTRRSAELEAGAESVGWKIGFNAKGLQQHFGLDGPVVGYLTDATVRPPGEVISLRGWHRPALEVEVAIRVGEDGGVAALAPALELVDLLPVDQLEQILAGNIFHRGVVFGPEIPGADVRSLAVAVRGGSGRLDADGRLTEDPEVTIGVVRSFLAAHGATLAAGDRIIAGSLIAPLPMERGDQLEVEFGPLGRLDARFS